jgi:hypothetical protein
MVKVLVIPEGNDVLVTNGVLVFVEVLTRVFVLVGA